MMKRALVLLAAIGVLATACGSGGPTQEEYEDALAQIEQLEEDLFVATSTTTTTAAPVQLIVGTFALTDKDGYHADGSARCWGTGGYDDIKNGVDVVVRDDASNVVGVSRLDNGTEVEGTFGEDCIFEFEVEVPVDLDFYVLEVGGRGDIAYSRNDLGSVGWIVALSLG